MDAYVTSTATVAPAARAMRNTSPAIVTPSHRLIIALPRSRQRQIDAFYMK
jgi:hypothetical protein